MKLVDRLETPLGEVQIERADPDDLRVMVELINDVLRWLTAIGMAGQWGTGPVPADPDHVPRDWMPRIEAGEQYIVTREGRPIAAFRVGFTAPIQEWGEVADAAYVSLLIARREVSGQGLGQALLDWAGRWAVRHGRRLLRLSCWADNDRLCRYYEQAGFKPRGEYDYTEEWRGRLFEKQL